MRSDPLLIRVTPAAVPFGTRKGFRRLADSVKRRQVRSVLQHLGAEVHTVVTPWYEPVLDGWGPGVVRVLRASDDHVAGSGMRGMSEQWVSQREASALASADVAVAVTEVLAQRWRGLGADPYVLRNGCSPVDPALLLRRPHSRDGAPVAGVVGYLSARIDLDVLEAVAEAGIRLRLIGPVDPHWEPARFAALTARPTVEYRGTVPADELPEELRQLHVGLTPYLPSDFNRASFPLKTLEYLAAGIPAVSTSIPASQWLQEDLVSGVGAEAAERHLALADSPHEFVAAIHRLTRQRTPELDEQRWRFSGQHSWAKRVGQFSAIIDETRSKQAEGAH